MNIVHISLSSTFTENMSYQDNLLSAQNKRDGHSVTVISNCSKFDAGQVIYAEPEDRVMDNGVRLIRLEYDKVLNSFISGKVRKAKELYSLLNDLKPDVILFHGIGWEILNAARYKKEHPSIKFYADSHADYNNSATNFTSKYFLHKAFYRSIIKESLPKIDKIFYLSIECGDFLKLMYHVPQDKMEFYPLGGMIIEGKERQAKRDKIRNKLKLSDEDILLVHSGKLDNLKRTDDILEALAEVPAEKLH